MKISGVTIFGIIVTCYGVFAWLLAPTLMNTIILFSGIGILGYQMDRWWKKGQLKAAKSRAERIGHCEECGRSLSGYTVACDKCGQVFCSQKCARSHYYSVH